MRFYWVRDRIRKDNFHIFRKEGKKNLGDYVKKHHPIWHHIKMRPRNLKATKKYTENQNIGKLGLGKGVLELAIPG